MFKTTKYVHLADMGKEVVEVFRTNVQHECDAAKLIKQLKGECEYEANFDLKDCDRILRVRGFEIINQTFVIELLASEGFSAEILPDEIPS